LFYAIDTTVRKQFLFSGIQFVRTTTYPGVLDLTHPQNELFQLLPLYTTVHSASSRDTSHVC
jgi:hypothetical protein